MKIIVITLFILAYIQPLHAERALQRVNMKSEQRVALVIGNNNYIKMQALGNPVNDARAMRESLKSRGFKVIYKENATKRDMKKLVKKFTHTISRGGVGMYFFAGHGVSVEGRNFLAGIDSVMDEEDDVEYEALALDYVISKMKKAGNRLNIVALDACRNNPFGRSGGGGLAPIGNAKGLFVAYATEAGAVASDNKNQKNGLFTKYLLTSMNEAGADLGRVFKNARKGVYEESNGEQSPGVYDQTLGDFYFTLPKNNIAQNNKPQNTVIAKLQSDSVSKVDVRAKPKAKPSAEVKKIVQSEGLVVDSKTGLMWQKCSLGLSGSTCTQGTAKTLEWDDAVEAARNNNDFGYSDWRLPTKKELVTLIVKGQNPVINRSLFPSTKASEYWTSSERGLGSFYSWDVNFSNGKASYGYRDLGYYVRLVRGTKLSSKKKIDVGTQVISQKSVKAKGIDESAFVVDSATGLMWQKCSLGLSGSTCTIGTAKTLDWDDAVEAGENNTDFGYSDWRLPTKEELETLMVKGQKPTINQILFPSTISNHYWSSSNADGMNNHAWDVNFGTGNSSQSMQDDLDYVRLVRGKEYSPE